MAFRKAFSVFTFKYTYYLVKPFLIVMFLSALFSQQSSSSEGGGGLPGAHGALPSIIDPDPMTTGTVVVKTEDPLMTHPQTGFNPAHEIPPCPEDTAHLMKAATSTAFAGDLHCHHPPEGITAAKDYAHDVKVGIVLFNLKSL